MEETNETDDNNEIIKEEVKVIFYSIWNLAYEARDRGLIQESRQML